MAAPPVRPVATLTRISVPLMDSLCPIMRAYALIMSYESICSYCQVFFCRFAAPCGLIPKLADHDA